MTDRPRPQPDDRTRLLATKLHAPPPPMQLVGRPRLAERLDATLDRPLAIVSAPPGFGKSTAVSAWMTSRAEAMAWMSADDRDRDAHRFWRHVAAALDLASEDRHELVDRVDSVLAGGSDVTAEELASEIVDGLADRQDPIVLVVDDHHAIESAEVHASVAFLLDHLPPALHLILLGRADPPLQLARLRSRGALVELRARDLRFDRAESTALLHAISGTEPPTEAAGALADRTEGWAAGLQLAGLSLREHPDPAAFAASFSGGHRFVLDLLTEEVLDRQPEDLRDFLLRTSILHQLSGPLCDAVTGRSDGQTTLEAAERDNLFLIPLDDERRWWRYHHLFGDLLRVQLDRRSPELRGELHRRACRWFDAEGLAAEAVRQAVDADDPALADEVVRRHADDLLLRSEGASWSWFTDLPAELLGSRRLLLAKARLALFDGRPVEATALLDAADEADAGTHNPTERRDLDANATLLRAYVAHVRGHPELAEQLAAAARDQAGPEATVLRLTASLHLAVVPWLRGDVTTAEASLCAGLERWRAEGRDDPGAWMTQYLGDIQTARGDLDAAGRTYRDLLDREAERPTPDAMAMAVGHIGLAGVAYRRNDLADARRHLDEGVARCRPFVYSQALATGLTMRAAVLHAEGDPIGSLDAIDEAVRVGPSTDVAPLLNPVPAIRARLLIAQGDLDAAEQQLGSGHPDIPTAARFPADLARADLLIARNEVDEALSLLRDLGAQAEADGRLGHLLEIEVMTAQGLSRVEDDPAALAALATALDRAARNRDLRVFLDRGPVITDLLRRLAARTAPRPASHRALLDLLVGSPAHEPAGDLDDRLAVPLTDREREILQLIALGRRNKDIAAELYVSLNTVKKHVTHIFEKLAVENRTAATARARQLGLVTDEPGTTPTSTFG